MRGWIFSALLAAPLALAAASPTLAQQPDQRQGQTMVRIAKGSPLAKVFFPEPGLLLDDDGTYSGAIQSVGRELGLNCGAVESFGWDFKDQPREQQQQHAETIYTGTMDALKRAGYALSEKKVRAIPDPETLVYTANGKENRLVLVWSPVTDATILLVCDAGKPAPADKAPAAKTPPAKK